MTRISLKEAYDNRDVIAWLATHQDAIEELQEILNNLPDPDLTNVVLKTGDQIIEGQKTFTDPIISQGGVTLASGGLHIGGDLQVDGDIIQDGSEYETHAEQVFSKNDLIVTRDGAIGAIVSGGISGVRVNKYDGVNSLNLGVDSTGTMRVGDLMDEQPLLTRDESEDMTSGALLKWDGVNKKAIAPASNVGSDVKPIKIVNGQAVVVENDLALDSAVVHNTGYQNVDGGIVALRNPYEASFISKSKSGGIISTGDIQLIQAQASDGTVLCAFYCFTDSDGKATVSMALRNADGTTRYVGLE